MSLPAGLPRLAHGPVVLRAFEERDVDVLLEAASDPLIPLITTVPTEGTRAAALAYVARQHERLASGAGYSFAIADAATDVAIGQIGLWTRDIASGRASTGYWLAPSARGQGFGTAALRALSGWALTLPEVERLELYVEPWNEASWRAAERCGYVREGLLRSWQRVGSSRQDMYVYSVVP